MRRIIFRLFIVFATWFIVHVTIITADGLTDNTEKADCLLVLGNTVNQDGSLSARLKSRLDKSFMLYQQGPCTTKIVSGRLGKEGYFEGSVMKNYLVALGFQRAPLWWTTRQQYKCYCPKFCLNGSRKTIQVCHCRVSIFSPDKNEKYYPEKRHPKRVWRTC